MDKHHITRKYVSTFANFDNEFNIFINIYIQIISLVHLISG